jgi:hypothetical protein
MNLGLVVDDRTHAVLQDRHESVLPRPDGQGTPAQRLHIRIKHKGLKSG